MHRGMLPTLLELSQKVINFGSELSSYMQGLIFVFFYIHSRSEQMFNPTGEEINSKYI